MWLYLSLAVATLVVLDTMIVLLVAVVARRAVPRERTVELKARLERYVVR